MAEMVVKIEGATAVTTPGGTGSATPVAQSAVPVLPASTSVLSGTAVANGTIITIPAGRTWYGYVSCSASYHAAAAGSTVVGVSTTGTGVVPPAAGKIFEIRLAVGGGTAPVEGADSQSVVTPYFAVYAPAGNAVTLALAVGAAQDVTASAYGWLA